MFYANFISLCNAIGKSPSAVAVLLGFKKSTVTRWKNGSIPTDSNIKRIADYFNVTVDALVSKEEQKEIAPTLNKRDERDIAKKLDEMLGQLGSSEEALMFDGEPLDEETRELLRASLKNSSK